MSEFTPLPTLEALKSQAKRLRARLSEEGRPISHSKALELIAHQFGYRDWNTIHAACGNQPPDFGFAPGDRVRGHYLGQSFEGEVIGSTSLNHGARYRTTIRFDEPVDVVTFDSFSAFRQRVTCVLDGSGISAAKTSDGQPHMRLQPRM